VVRTNANDPLRPVVAVLSADLGAVTTEVDLAGSSGANLHVVETVPPPENAPPLRELLETAL
jgi:hypothetical protein